MPMKLSEIIADMEFALAQLKKLQAEHPSTDPEVFLMVTDEPPILEHHDPPLFHSRRDPNMN
jgi:hypothetical protein